MEPTLFPLHERLKRMVHLFIPDKAQEQCAMFPALSSAGGSHRVTSNWIQSNLPSGENGPGAAGSISCCIRDAARAQFWANACGSAVPGTMCASTMRNCPLIAWLCMWRSRSVNLATLSLELVCSSEAVSCRNNLRASRNSAGSERKRKERGFQPIASCARRPKVVPISRSLMEL